MKEKFFMRFYNHLAQAVYHCLKTAFPKNRNTIETSMMKRKLLNTFSELFTGVVIQTAKWRHWTDQKSSSKTEEEPAKISLADIGKKAPVKSKRQQECLRYSPLVERYLMTHKYETSNNVKGWKMMLTQNTGASKEVDRKFKMYLQISKQSVKITNQMQKQYEEDCAEMKLRLAKNEKQAKDFIKGLKQSSKEKLQNGGYAEYSNMITSIFNSEHLNNDH